MSGLVAEQFAALDTLSGGRLVVGAGLGYRDEEFDAFGVPRDQRVRRFVEARSIAARARNTRVRLTAWQPTTLVEPTPAPYGLHGDAADRGDLRVDHAEV